jgi:hypothetical protein
MKPDKVQDFGLFTVLSIVPTLASFPEGPHCEKSDALQVPCPEYLLSNPASTPLPLYAAKIQNAENRVSIA